MSIKFTTKKYTLVSLIGELQTVPTTKFNSLSTLARTISPRSGVKSAKVAAINKFLGRGNSLTTIFGTSSSTKTVKSTVVGLLRNRKNSV